MYRWLARLLDNEFFPAVAPLDNTPEGREQAHAWAKWLKQQWCQQRGLCRLRQQQSPMTQTRNAIKQRLGTDHVAYEMTNFSTDEWIAINLPSQDSLQRRNENQKLIHNPDAIVEQATTLLDSTYWADIAAGLSLLTGRRVAEILKTGQFTYKTTYTVSFTGQLKRHGELRPLTLEIPTLAPARRVLDAVARLRERLDTDGLDHQQVTERYRRRVAQACDRHFQDLVPKREGKDTLYTHLSRTIYARIAVHWFCPPQVTDIAYMAAIQGHYHILEAATDERRRNLASTRNYFDYKIGDGHGNLDGRQGIRLDETEVEIIDPFRPEPHSEATADTAMSDTPESQPATPEPTTELGQRARELLNSDRYTLLLIGLMAATGRSAGELIASGVFRPTEGDGYALQFGQQVGPHWLIGTLVPTEEVLDALERLRQHPSVQSLRPLAPQDIDRRCKPYLTRVIRDRFRHWRLRSIDDLLSQYRELAPAEGQVESIEEATAQDETATYLVWQQDKEALRSLAPELGTRNQASTLHHMLQLAQWARAQAQRWGIEPTPQALNAQLQAYEERAQAALAAEATEPAEPAPAQNGNGTATEPSGNLTAAIASLVEQQQQLTQVLTQFVQQQGTAPAPASAGNGARSQAPSRPAETTERRVSRSERAEAKVRRAIDALMAWNNEPGRNHRDKLRINLNALKQLTRAYQGAIYRVLDERREAIEEHHQRHGIGPKHRNRHHANECISPEQLANRA